jgi:hypothetical protein
VKKRKRSYIEEAMKIVQENENIESFGKEWGTKVMDTFISQGRGRGFEELEDGETISMGRGKPRVPNQSWIAYAMTWPANVKENGKVTRGGFAAICIDEENFGKVIARLINIKKQKDENGVELPNQPPPNFEASDVSSAVGMEEAQSDPDRTSTVAGEKLSTWYMRARSAAGRGTSRPSPQNPQPQPTGPDSPIPGPGPNPRPAPTSPASDDDDE